MGYLLGFYPDIPVDPDQIRRTLAPKLFELGMCSVAVKRAVDRIVAEVVKPRWPILLPYFKHERSKCAEMRIQGQGLKGPQLPPAEDEPITAADVRAVRERLESAGAELPAKGVAPRPKVSLKGREFAHPEEEAAARQRVRDAEEELKRHNERRTHRAAPDDGGES